MSTVKVFSARALVAVMALSMVFMFAGANQALALTADEADLICALFGCDDDQQAAIDALVSGGGSGGGSCPALVQPLTIGSTGQAVTDLQMYMMDNGIDIPAISSGAADYGYFGTQTQAAVAAWQTVLGVTPAVGYFGPLTLAAYNASCVAGDDDDDDVVDDDSDDVLSGGAGSVEQYELVGNINNEEVGEDEEDVKVWCADIEADEGSDLMFTALRLDFDQGTANRDFEKYADEVSIWWEGDEFAKEDSDRWDDDNAYARTVSLDSGAILDAGDTGEMCVAVSGITNLDSADEGETWTLDVTSVRFRDGQDASVSEDPGLAARTFSFESFASAANTELKFAEDDEDINEAHVLDVDGTNDTDNIPLLSFTTEVEGDSDVYFDDLPVNFDVTGATDVDDLVGTVSLWLNGDEISSESLGVSVGADETVIFDDLDIWLGSGDIDEWLVTGDFEPLSGDADAGDTISAQISATERAAGDFEDESGEDLTDGTEVTGTVIGEAHVIYDNGIQVELVSVSKNRTFVGDATGEDDQGEFEVVFDVTAFGADMRLDKSIEAGGADAAGQGTEYTITSSAGTPTVSSALVESSSTDAEDTANTFEIDENKTRRFTMQLVLTADTTPTPGSHEVAVESFNWGTATDDTNANYYTFNLDEFKTGSLFLNAQ